MARQTMEQVEASLKRWRTRLKRAVNAIDKLERARRRLAVEKKPAPQAKPAHKAHAIVAKAKAAAGRAAV